MRSRAGLSIKLIHGILIFALTASGAVAYQQAESKPQLTPDMRSALDRISADSLRGHLSFIASDMLEGRGTPSRGLDIAAHYIAAQFRRAGLEPVGDDNYFQTANWSLAQLDMKGFELKISDGNETINVGKDQVSLPLTSPIALKSADVIKVDYKDRAALDLLKQDQVEGKVILTEVPDIRRGDRSRMSELFRARSEFINKLDGLKAALIISIDRTSASGASASRLIDPDNRQPVQPTSGPPLVTVHNIRLVKMHDEIKAGATRFALSLSVAGIVESPVKLRNVVGLLRGSDPALKDTYVLVTAHYDHIGMAVSGEGDRIYNGANDDGSGTVAVVEMAAAFASLKQRPKRSIIFMTFFGEEKGLLGSRFYGSHPLVPIEKTVANINIEQIGRTDDSEGPQISRATVTGFDYSDIGVVMKAAGEITGVNVYKHEQNSDAFFGRSDNQALADQGVPAHTVGVAFLFPDYHGLGDHWEKIDYANLEKVSRMIALGVLMIADSAEAPKWNEANPKAARYLKAWRDRRGQ